MLRNWLAHPLTRGLDIDDPQVTLLRRQIIQEKPFLRRIYQEWYASIVSALPSKEGLTLELGSGAGFLNEWIPGLLSSEVFLCSNVALVLDGERLPLKDGCLDSIVMVDVLHHLPHPRQFFREASRCIKAGGAIVMVEPWVSNWSRLVYTRLHHEPFDPAASSWEFPAGGPLSGANGALPWILFERDRARFEVDFPEWKVLTIQPFMPFRYLVSGGVSLRSLMPGFMFPFWRWLESALSPWNKNLAMFALISLRRRG